MSRIFISHSSNDNFAAGALADWLAEGGWTDVFLDVDPERGIAAGQRWERSLHQAADRCEAVILVVTRAWLASGWCRKEYELARSLWDTATGRPISVLTGHDKVLYGAMFSPDGTRVVTASDDKTARVWDTATGQPIAVLKGHDREVMSATFSPDGTRVVTAALDKTVRLWDTATGLPTAVLKGHDSMVLAAAFSPDGTRVVTASLDGTARVWDISAIPKGDIFHIACAWLPDHDLTDVARGYALTDVAPICEGDPPLPDPPAAASP